MAWGDIPGPAAAWGNIAVPVESWANLAGLLSAFANIVGPSEAWENAEGTFLVYGDLYLVDGSGNYLVTKRGFWEDV